MCRAVLERGPECTAIGRSNDLEPGCGEVVDKDIAQISFVLCDGEPVLHLAPLVVRQWLVRS